MAVISDIFIGCPQDSQWRFHRNLVRSENRFPDLTAGLSDDLQTIWDSSSVFSKVWKW